MGAPGGFVVFNAGRGGRVIDDDVIKALVLWHIAGATLDIFHTGPRASHHRFWAHPKVNVIPHASSLSTARSGALQMEENIRRARRGQSLLNVIDREAGY